MSGYGYGNHPHGQPPNYHAGPSQPPLPPRSRTGLITAITLLALILIGALIFFFMQPEGDAAESDRNPTPSIGDPGETVSTDAMLSPEDAEQTVEAYFTALADGDAEAALALIETDLDTTLVDNAIYGAVANRPALEELTVVSASDTEVVLSARVTEADGQANVEFIVELIDGSITIVSDPYYKFSLLDRERFMINETSIVLAGGSDYLLLPGDWDFAYATYGWLFRVTTAGEGIEVEGGPIETDTSDPSLSGGEALTQEEKDAVQVQLYTQIISCLDDPHFAPAGCENTLFMDDPGIAVTGISRTIEESPEMTFHVDGDQHYAELNGGLLTIDSLQRLTEDDEWEPAEPIYRTNIFNGVRLPISGRGADIKVDFSEF